MPLSEPTEENPFQPRDKRRRAASWLERGSGALTSPRSDRSALELRVSVLPAISGVETSLRGKRTQAVVSRRENKHTDPQAEVRR